MSKIYELKITLRDTKPAIWRRFQVESDYYLAELQEVVEIVMGWYACHAHQFRKDTVCYGDPETIKGCKDYETIQLSSILKKEGDSFQYEYDFGDGWIHDIVLEKILPINKKVEYPICVAGEMNCPPDDCGGIPGFYNMLAILKDKKHPEYKNMIEWLEGDYDPKEFDLDEVNNYLHDYEDDEDDMED